MIAGQSPRMRWRKNPNGERRTIEDAVEIAKYWGVDIRDDVHIFLDDLGELNENLTAKGPRVDKPSGTIMYWSHLVHDVTNKIPFRLWPGIMDSDEAIVAVIAHEMHEINSLRTIFRENEMSIDGYINETCVDNPGNLHDTAWDVADRLVEEMRRRRGES